MEIDKFPRFSGMNFVSKNTFPIEDSTAYLAIRDKGVRSVEFIRKTDDRLLFVEARSSIAHPDSTPEEYYKQIREIHEKHIHSLNLLSSIKIGVVQEQLPDSFNTSKSVSLVFVVVIRDFDLEWCRRVEASLNHLLPDYMVKIWRPLVMVINYDTAKRMQFVS